MRRLIAEPRQVAVFLGEKPIKLFGVLGAGELLDRGVVSASGGQHQQSFIPSLRHAEGSGNEGKQLLGVGALVVASGQPALGALEHLGGGVVGHCSDGAQERADVAGRREEGAEVARQPLRSVRSQAEVQGGGRRRAVGYEHAQKGVRRFVGNEVSERVP